MNNTTTPLEGGLLLVNQLELVAPTTVAGTIYGIAFTLFCLYVHALVPQVLDPDKKRQARFMLVYSCVLMLCGLYNLVSNAWATQDAYIKHTSYPGGPFEYVLTTFHTSMIIIGITCQMVIRILTSAIQIWRVWVVWSATRYANVVIVLPSLCFLTFTALNLRSLILGATLSKIKFTHLDMKTARAELATQAAVTLLCTALISLFLCVQQWHQRKLIGKAQGYARYMKIVALLVESYALESIWLLLEASVSNSNAVGSFFAETETYIETIAYLLVQYRVASRTAVGSQRGQSKISSLHWNHSHHTTTQFEATSEAGGDPYVSTKAGALDALPATSMA